MALTQISTAGVKDDAVTAGKIPANAVGSSELADNAVDTNAIADDAVTAGKLADDIAINTTGTITAASFSGPATQVSLAAQSSDTDCFPVFSLNATGNQALFTKSNRLAFNSSSGALTATSFVGDGSNLTGITQTTINNNADNRVITGSGTANTLNGESSVVIDSSGRLMIGTTTEGNGGADDLTVANSGSGGITIRSGTSNDGNLWFSDGTSGNAEYRGYVQYEHANDRFNFGTAATTKLSIDSSGKVGIGTTSPDSMLHLSFDSGDSQIRLTRSNSASNTNDYGRLLWESSSDVITGRIAVARESGEDNGYMHFATASGGTLAERVRIDSSGRVGIKNTNMSSFNTGMDDLVIGNGVNGTSPGMTIFSNAADIGTISFRDSADTGVSGLIQYRHNESPPYMKFMVEGTQRMSITTHGGIAFNSDTAAANTLDDYEEGNFSATVANGGTVSSFTHNKCSYTKIGRLVYFQLYLQISGSGSSGSFRIGNFPFTSASYTNNGYGAAYIGYQNNVFQNSGNTIAYFSPSDTRLNFYEANGAAIAGNSGNIFGNRDFIIVGSYITA